VRYVRGGGRLLLTGAAGVYDRYYRTRRQPISRIRNMRDYARAAKPLNGFHELVGPDPLGSPEATIRRKAGKGRAAWIRAMDVDHLPRTPDNWMIGEDWFMLPRNADRIDAVLAWLAPEGFGVQVHTHAKLYVHLAEREDTGEWLVHLVHHEPGGKLARADVRLDVPREPSAVVSISSDDGEDGYPERKERFERSGRQIVVPVEDIRSHRTVIVRF
jgi:hypothetical protein